MNKKLENIVTYYYPDNIDYKFVCYNNIDIDLGLSIDPVSYILNMPQDKKTYLNTNMLVMNIEDIDSIYNVFDHRKESYAYQTSNVLFINSNQDIYPLNYNLENLSYFSISYHDINLNLLDRTFVGVNGFSYQTIFSYNSPNYSYIYGDDSKLQTISYTTQGIYKIDDDNIKLEEESLTINTTKFKYNNANINTFINKTNNVIKQYKDNDPIYFINDNYENKFIEITDRNVSVKRKINFSNSKTSCEFIIKDTDWFIIDIPVIYWYESFLTKNFEYLRKLCPITINGGNNVGDLNVDIFDNPDNTNTIFNKLIGVDYSKSFIHNNKCLSLKYDNDAKIFKLIDSCNISLYFRVNKDIYDYVYNLDNIKTKNKFNIEVNIQFSDKLYKFKFVCVVDVMNRLFKKLYHNYNYGFNFDNHGKCVGLLYLQKSSDALIKTQQENESIEKINEFRSEQEQRLQEQGLQEQLPKLPISYLSNTNYSYIYYNDISVNNKYINIFEDIDDDFHNIGKNDIKTINKDIFVNFDLESLDNIIVENKNIDHNKISTEDIGKKFIDEVICIDFIENSAKIIKRKYNNHIKYPETLKQRDFNILYKNDYPTINIYNNDSSDLYLNPVFIDTKFGNLKLLKIPKAEVYINNHYIMNYDDHKKIFNDIYNYHKTGFLKGDFYTPCVQDYILFNLFNIKNYLNYKVYKEFVEKLRGNIKFLTNQFRENISSKLYQYVIDNKENDYQINTYSSIDGKKLCYIWPVFSIPDYSIINSNDYIIIYNENDNCEYIDYYINTQEKSATIYINCRSYSGKLNINILNNIYDENFNKISKSDINIIESNLIDKDNDIYQLSIYINEVKKINTFYICFKDSEEYMNHLNIENDNYRVLCKVYVKNDGI